MKKFLILITIASFNSYLLSLENFNECEIFEEKLKRDFHAYSFDEPDVIDQDRIYFKYTNSSYGRSSSAEYERNKQGSIFIETLPIPIYELHKITPGTEVVKINSVDLNAITDEEIDSLIENAYSDGLITLSVIDKFGIARNYEIDLIDLYTELVNIDFEVINIESVDSITSTYDARYTLTTTWTLDGLENLLKEIIQKEIASNPSLTDALKKELFFFCEYDAEIFKSFGVWSPNVNLSNAISIEEDSSKDKYAFVMTYYPANGSEEEVYLAEIFHTTTNTAVFKSYFNYQPFPFDRQNLSFNFESSGLTPMFNLYSGKLEKSFNSLELYEWKKKSFDTGYYFIDDSYDGYDKGIYYQINIERNFGYFLTKIYLPIVLILFLAFSTLWIKPSEIESRLTVSVVCFLALITYTFIIDKDLPKLPYLTSMDMIILISYLFAAIPTLEAVYVNRNIHNYNAAESMDMKFRTYLPFLYLFITLAIIALTIINHPNAIQALIFTT